jgi:hypothetical protein
MRLRLIIAVIAVVALTAVLVSDAFAKGGYRTYTTCVPGGSKDSTCVQGDGWGGVFKAKNGKKTHYRLCVNPPSGASKQCRKLRTNRKGKGFAFVFIWYRSTLPLGTYKFTWKKGGHMIDRDAMNLRSEGV